MRSRLLVPAVVLALFCLPLFAAQSSPKESGYRVPRVFVTDSGSWEVNSGGGGSADGFGATGSGGARPQTAEIIKTFGQRCLQVVVNNKREVADYIVVLDHEGGKNFLLHKNKVAVFDRRSGDIVISRSTRSLGNSVQDACASISKHWQEHGVEMRAVDLRSNEGGANSGSRGAKLKITSNPAGAEIEMDGAFVGNAPSVLEVEPGDHIVTLKKNGYRLWQRKMRVSKGEARLDGALELASEEVSASK